MQSDSSVLSKMSEPRSKKIFWDAPRVSDFGDFTEIEFRDALIRLVNGVVAEYVDTERGITLRPIAEDPEEWIVLDSSDQPTRQRWRGFIAFDGQQLLIQQEKHSRLRLYGLDGTVETQLRISRIVEVSGTRKTTFNVGVVMLEDLETNEVTVNFGDRIVVRSAAGEGRVSIDDGETFANEEIPEDAPMGEEYSNPALAAYSQYLRPWSDFVIDEPNIFALEAPPAMHYKPGLATREPAAGNKPDNLREVRCNDFGDGILLYQYCGRRSGTPYLSHELVSRNGLLLARSIEYDQPQKIVFEFHDGEREIIDGVISLECEFDPEQLFYATKVAQNDGLTATYHGPPLAARELSEAPT